MIKVQHAEFDTVIAVSHMLSLCYTMLRYRRGTARRSKSAEIIIIDCCTTVQKWRLGTFERSVTLTIARGGRK